MNVILLLGAPGSGKGTVAERIRDATGYRHVSTGDVLREAVKSGSPIGLECEAYMRRGELVPDPIMVRLVEALLREGPTDAGYMFDGFPRTVAQADMLDDMLARCGGAIAHVVFLETPRAVLIQRLTGRRICRDCGTSFHVVNMPPRQAGICDRCGGELYQRPDDSEATIVNRLDVFNAKTEALIERYRQAGLLRWVDSQYGADRLAADVLRLIRTDG